MGRKSPHRGAKRLEDFRQKQVTRFKKLEADAINHMAGRNRHVAEVLCYFSMLNNAGAVSHLNLGGAGAKFQATRGSRPLDQEAAHQLPCQIMVNGVDPTNLPVGGLPQARSMVDRIRAAFGAVTVADRALNTADKACERVVPSIADAFVVACRAVLGAPSTGAADKRVRGHGQSWGELRTVSHYPINQIAVRNAFSTVWLPRSTAAYLAALDAVVEFDFALGPRDDKDEVIANLGVYLAHNEPPTIFQPTQIQELELLFAAA